MLEERFFPPMSELRKRCDALLAQAIQSGDPQEVNKFSRIRNSLRNEDFLKRENWGRYFTIYRLQWLGYSRDFVEAAKKAVEEAYKFRGILQYRDLQGNVYRREAILDPEVEEYYFFEDFGFYKIRNSRECYYLNRDGQWVFDGDGDRIFSDVQYTYYRANILKE